jgi:hypothetical protein
MPLVKQFGFAVPFAIDTPIAEAQSLLFLLEKYSAGIFCVALIAE